MRIALVSSYVPFVHGGYRNIVDWLESILMSRGHTVEKVYLPHVDLPEKILTQAVSYRALDLDGADRVICFRPPAHLICHPHKIIWFIHHIRVFYDLWGTPLRGFSDDDYHRALRKKIHQIDTKAFSEARGIFSNSRVVSDRLRHYNNTESTVLYPPVLKPEDFYCDGYNDEILYVSRVEHHKRQHLLIDAMRYVKSKVRLRICGVSSNDDYVRLLEGLIKKYRLEKQVSFENRWVSDAEKISMMSKCLMVAYIPLDEDSYGYPSLEASHSRKAILTTTDSGGVLELVSHGHNGYVCEPNPINLAEAMDRAYDDRGSTERLGHRAHLKTSEMKISWDHVIKSLLA